MWKTHAFAKMSQTRQRNAAVRRARRSLDRAPDPSRARSHAHSLSTDIANARSEQKNAKLVREADAALKRAAALDPARRAVDASSARHADA